MKLNPLHHMLAIGFMTLPGALHGTELNVLASTEIDPGALNFSATAASFSQNINGRTYQRAPLSTLNGYQYATYYDGNRRVCLARRKLPAGDWNVIRFNDYTIAGNDSHNVVALGICAADGTIHVAFDHHAGPLHYRVSAVGAATNPEGVVWSTALFGPVTDHLGSLGPLSSVTYPSFFNAPNGNLMLYYRSGGSGNGDGMIQEYNGATRQWTSGMGKFISRSGSYTGTISTKSTSRNPYINGISYAGNRLHASWGWRETGESLTNHDLNYAFSDDHGRTWRNSAGTEIGTTGSNFISISSPGLTVASISQGRGLSNQYTHHAYPDGSCHVIVDHDQAGSTTDLYHHYWRNAAGAWSVEVLPFLGSRPKLVGDDNQELFLTYTAGGTLRVAKGTPNASATAWSWSTIHTQSGRTEGGEGLVDTTRWETERILSAYGQVAPDSSGAPTALHVFDYQVSSKAILPVPADKLADVSGSPQLAWTAGIDATSHRVYFGTDRAAVISATPSSREFRGEQLATSYSPTGPLAKNTTYYWRIDEVKAGSVVSPGLLWSFTTSADYLFSGATDASVRDDNVVVDQTNATTQLGSGGSSPHVDRSTVHVFQLPDLGLVANPFLSAAFTFHYEAKQGTLVNNDLYGLGRRDSPAVLSSDYYGQSTASDPTDATRLQTDILTNGTPFGAVGTSAAGNTALLSYLNAQYASGAGIGQYVFLRLNTTAPKTGVNRATITMSEGGGAGPPETRPRIAYSANTAPTISIVSSASTRQDTPTAALPFTVGDAETAASSLAVTASSSDTTLLPHAGILLGGSGANRTVTVTPAPGQTGTGVITLQVSDGARTTSASLTLSVMRRLLASPGDADIQITPGSPPTYSVQNLTASTLAIGTAGTASLGKDRCAVIPFQLPDFGAVANPFITAAFFVDHVSNQGSPAGNVTIYGLGGRSGATVLTTDYWAATPGVDPTDATLLQNNLIPSGSTTSGIRSTDETGSANLLSYLNTQYAGGSGAGRFVFLRLGADAPQPAGSTRYNITSADGAAASSNSSIWPQIGYTAFTNSPPTIGEIADLGIPVNTASGPISFVIGDEHTAATSLTLGKTSSNQALVPAPGIVFGGSGANRTVTITPAANRLGSSIITVTVSDGDLTSTSTFGLTVFGNPSETWRFLHFGTTSDAGSAADRSDPNGDGENNLLEFATGQDPNAATTTSTPLLSESGNLEFTYTRSKAAMADGVQFVVEWSDSLGVWNSAGVTEQILADNGTMQSVKATLHAATQGRFVHLKVTR